MARALGWRFFTRKGGEIVRWTELVDLADARPPSPMRLFRQVTVAVDVRNRLLGKLGCSRVYGPQKGLNEDDFPIAEKALGRLARVMARRRGEDRAKLPGAGAAGGLGFGLAVFTGARLSPGFAMISRALGLPRLIRHADLVVTGEGMLDRSTAMGKGTGELASLCAAIRRPCLGLGGQVKDRNALQSRFAMCRAITDLVSTEEALRRSDHWLESLGAAAADDWSKA